VRWRQNGKHNARQSAKHHTRRFADGEEALRFDARVNRAGRAAQRMRASRASVDGRVEQIEARRETSQGRGGVYPCATSDGVRWRFVYRQSDGSLSSRCGFTSRTAAATAHRKLIESVDRGEGKVRRETFSSFWERFCAERRAI
jgi:hypothetical protein